MKKIKIKIPIFLGQLHVYVTNDHLKVLKRYNEVTQDNSNNWGATNITTSKNGIKLYILTIRKDHLTSSTIAHESLHIVNRILLDRGIETSYQNDEVACYLLGWFVKQICKLK